MAAASGPLLAIALVRTITAPIKEQMRDVGAGLLLPDLVDIVAKYALDADKVTIIIPVLAALEDVESIRCLCDTFACARGAFYGTYQSLSEYCHLGLFRVIELYIDYFGLTLAAVHAMPRDNELHLLPLLCWHGHLECAKGLVARLGYSRADVRGPDGQALHNACARGHLSVAKWLVATFDLTADDVRIHRVRNVASQRGYLRVVEWIDATFGTSLGL